ncbi:MAG: hypothetical protein ABW007_07780 [Chitinophagaceae bacterium]
MPRVLFTSDNNPRKGRKLGSRNRTTQEIRDTLTRVFDRNLIHIEEDLKKMSPQARWQILEKLGKYILPTFSVNENLNDNTGEMKIVVEYEQYNKLDDKSENEGKQIDEPTDQD